ncbi:hypothetical protein Sinac_6535 [Singulisphaera acidiphila DSM 18658]|uniref:Uncharacterized protein n=1 Tax=Singulisphaera acidiphila (strain ATCC BAA-1392 / DSM 18658 / VKM B-2454 / MOB10) TaxID=886293 RepID=L0DP66_SINAD|nr:hypothetical protein Sinac_6535 [Singulisphaera acidiphila DSM 18658]
MYSCGIKLSLQTSLFFPSAWPKIGMDVDPFAQSAYPEKKKYG